MNQNDPRTPPALSNATPRPSHFHKHPDDSYSLCDCAAAEPFTPNAVEGRAAAPEPDWRADTWIKVNYVWDKSGRGYISRLTDKLTSIGEVAEQYASYRLAKRAADLQRQRDEARRERDDWKKALHSLTVGGSEFANDWKACVEHVRKRQSSQHETILRFKAARESAEAANQELRTERDQLAALLDTPEIEDFDKAVPLEAAHQVKRWGIENDAGKEPQDWFWLIGYLAGKALRSHLDGNTEKARHHCISTAAALRNWHSHVRTGETLMRPGIEPPAALLGPQHGQKESE